MEWFINKNYLVVTVMYITSVYTQLYFGYFHSINRSIKFPDTISKAIFLSLPLQSFLQNIHLIYIYSK